MENKILSLVIPAYNMEKYLSRCVDSILIPILMKYVEVLIINDGSTDNTLSIASKYQQLYPDYIKVIDKKNGNYGSVLNMAIATANGKYFKTLDADDWYHKNEFQKFIFDLLDCDEDLIITGYCYYFEDLKKELPAFSYKERHWNKTLDIKSKSLFYYKLNNELNMPAMAYKLSILKENKIQLQEKTYYTDSEFVYLPIHSISTIKLIPYNVYVYYIGRNDQSISKESVLRNFDSMYRICDRLTLDYLNTKDKQGTPQQNKLYLLYKYINGVYKYIYLTEKYNTQILEFDRKIKSQDMILYNNLTEQIKTHNIPYLKLYRQGYSNKYIQKKIARIEKLKRSLFYRIYSKLKRNIISIKVRILS